MKKRTLFNVAICFTSLLLTGCTLEDPTVTGDGSSSTGLKLSSITSSGLKVWSISYDSKGRITKIDGSTFYDSRVDIEYNPLKITEYEDSYSMTVYSDITLNSDNFITSAYEQGYRRQDDSGNWKLDGSYIVNSLGETVAFVPDCGYINLKYDSNGHLTYCDYDGEKSSYNWSNGNLVSSEYEKDNDWVSWTYSSTLNQNSQWSPSWFSPLFLTGYFGNPPKNLVSAISSSDNDNVKFGYQINSSGYIEKEQVTEDDETIVLTYNYIK